MDKEQADKIIELLESLNQKLEDVIRESSIYEGNFYVAVCGSVSIDD